MPIALYLPAYHIIEILDFCEFVQRTQVFYHTRIGEQNCFISQQLLYTLVGYNQMRFGHLNGHHQW
jgi:hypothetical protein